MKHSRVFFAGFLAAALASSVAIPSGVRAADDPQVAALIASSGAALGVARLGRIRTLRLRGDFTLVGVKGTADSWQDVRDGRSASYADAGLLSGAQGYDGAHVWNRDASGVVWNDDGTAARLGALDGIYQSRFLLWTPDRGGAAVTSGGRKTEAGIAYDVLRVTPPGGVPFDLWLDAATHLPARSITTIGVTTATSTFSDYRAVDGVQIPFVQRSDTDGNVTLFAAKTADVNDPGAEGALRRPAMHVDDFTLPSGTTTVPFELVDNHVDLDVTIDGKGPFHFLFDTGGANFLDSEVAKQLGLTAAGNAAGSGVGAASEAVQFATADTVRIGEATLRKQVFIVAPVRAGFGIASGKPVDGLIGFEVLSRFVTTFDYGTNTVVLRTAAPPPPAGATVMPFVFDGQHVNVPCAIDSFTGTCTIDTGSRIALSVLSPFLAAHPSIVAANATAVGANGFGIGGPALGRLGRTTLQLGPYTIPDTISDLSTQTKGAFADPYTAGNVGAGTLKRFALTFDYARQTMTLVPNAAFATRETYDRSGIFLITQGGKVIVADVRPGTPAADAGVLRGDVITAVGGKDASTYALGDIRTLLRGAAGTKVPLALNGQNGASRNVTITLRDYI